MSKPLEPTTEEMLHHITDPHYRYHGVGCDLCLAVEDALARLPQVEAELDELKLELGLTAEQLIATNAHNEDLKAELEKVGAERDELLRRLRSQAGNHSIDMIRTEKMEAELARLAPLAEAAEKSNAEWIAIEIGELSRIRTSDTPTMMLLRAAITFKEQEKP